MSSLKGSHSSARLPTRQTTAPGLIRACCLSLGLVNLFTVVEDECRAWTVPAGADAVTATGDMNGARAAGKVRLEGKAYVLRDGDVINIRFNV